MLTAAALTYVAAAVTSILTLLYYIDARAPQQLTDVTRPRIPDEVLTAAHERAKARAERDWATADRLRAEIEAAGWTVVDRGTDFALSPAAPPDVEEGARVRYGASRNVPSRLEEPPAGSRPSSSSRPTGRTDLERAVDSLRFDLAGRDVRRGRRGCAVRRAGGGAWRDARPTTRDRLDQRAPGSGAATNVGIRRATGPVVVLMDTSVEPSGDVVTPLIRALDDPSVAVAGGWGITSARPADVRGCAARRRRRDRGLPARVPARGLPPPAARSTSASASTATSTSGGASSCATPGKGRSRARAVRVADVPGDAARAPRLGEPPRGGPRPPVEAQLLPDHRPVRIAPRPAGQRGSPAMTDDAIPPPGPEAIAKLAKLLGVGILIEEVERRAAVPGRRDRPRGRGAHAPRGRRRDRGGRLARPGTRRDRMEAR